MFRGTMILTWMVVCLSQAALRADCPPDAIFCDNFNTYCAGGGYPGGAGDPADADCASATSPDNVLLRSVWAQSSTHEGIGDPCGENIELDAASPISTPAASMGPAYQVLSSVPFAARVPGNASQLIGQMTFRDWEAPNTPNLSRLIGNAFGPEYSAVAGTDLNPLVVSFFVSSKGGPVNFAGRIWYSDGYIELGYGDDSHMNRANTDYGLVADVANGQSLCCSPPISQGPWPVICAVGQRDDPSVAMPANCPTSPPPVHNAIAVGILANYDNNPCHCGGAHGGTLFHPVIFNGRGWWQIKHNNPVASGGTVTHLDGTPANPVPTDVNAPGRFVLYGGQPPSLSAKSMNWITLTIRSTSFSIEMRTREISPSTGQEYYVISTMDNIPRIYGGPFDRLRAGVGPGCLLASADSWETCRAGTARSCLDNNGNQAHYVDFDDLVLAGGEGDSPVGACCHMNGICTQELPQDCLAPGDVHAGPNTPCSAAACCPHGTFVWADADADGDVDADDFARFQLCYSGPDAALSDPDCACFDRTGDDDVDGPDYLEFIDCVSGANVPWTPGLTPDCTP